MRRSILLISLAAAGLFAVNLSSCANYHSRPPGHGDLSFDISPAGDQLVFNAAGDGGRDLYLMTFPELRVTRIAATAEYEVDPRFSPDGKRIVYAAGKPGERADHLFIRSLTGDARQITSTEANDSLPSFSPDGKRIVFLRDKTYNWGGKAASWGGDEIACVMDVDGSNLRELTRPRTMCGHPRFSKDGESVEFWRDGAIYAIAVDGADDPRKLREQAEVYAAYSTDDASIAYSQGVYSPDLEIFVADLNGANARQITDSDEGSMHPLFTPDGRKLLYFRESWPGGLNSVPKKSLWEVRLADGEERRLADYALFDDPLGWRRQRH
ncbi:MAG TPA: hypothetical protein VF175_14650 [Lacipirellula sp.]